MDVRQDEWFHFMPRYDAGFVDVRMQEMAKRAMTISAVGEHSLLMLDVPENRNPMLAKRLPMILPYKYLGVPHSNEPDFFAKLASDLMLLLEIKGLDVCE